MAQSSQQRLKYLHNSNGGTMRYGFWHPKIPGTHRSPSRVMISLRLLLLFCILYHCYVTTIATALSPRPRLAAEGEDEEYEYYDDDEEEPTEAPKKKSYMWILYVFIGLLVGVILIGAFFLAFFIGYKKTMRDIKRQAGKKTDSSAAAAVLPKDTAPTNSKTKQTGHETIETAPDKKTGKDKKAKTAKKTSTVATDKASTNRTSENAPDTIVSKPVKSEAPVSKDGKKAKDAKDAKKKEKPKTKPKPKTTPKTPKDKKPEKPSPVAPETPKTEDEKVASIMATTEGGATQDSQKSSFKSKKAEESKKSMKGKNKEKTEESKKDNIKTEDSKQDSIKEETEE